MKHLFIALAAASAAFFSSAQVVEVDAGAYHLRVGKGTGKTWSEHATPEACYETAKDKGLGSYSCIRTDAVTVVPEPLPPHPPPPPPPPEPEPEPPAPDGATWAPYPGTGKFIAWAAPFTARFGAAGQYVIKAFPAGTHACDVATFGSDPAPGGEKKCERMVLPTAPPVALPPVSTGPEAPTPWGSVFPTSGAQGPGPLENEIRLIWTPPFKNTDGSPLTDLAGYIVRYGDRPGVFSQSIDLPYPGIDTHVFRNVPAGMYYLSLQAYNKAGAVSEMTPEVSKLVPEKL